MKDMGIIYMSAAQAKPLIINYDTVYVHTDIEKIETDIDGQPTDNLYKAHEFQYNKDEYLELMAEQGEMNQSLLSNINTNVEQILKNSEQSKEEIIDDYTLSLIEQGVI